MNLLSSFLSLGQSGEVSGERRDEASGGGEWSRWVGERALNHLSGPAGGSGSEALLAEKTRAGRGECSPWPCGPGAGMRLTLAVNLAPWCLTRPGNARPSSRLSR